MLHHVVEDGEITESYGMPDHDETHHLVTAGNLEEITGVSVNTTLDETYHTVLVDATGGARTITLPPAAAHLHRIYNIKKIDVSVNAVTIDGNGGETIEGAATQTLPNQWDAYTIQSNGTAWFIIAVV